MKVTKVGVVCPSAILREGLSMLIQADGSIQVVWSVEHWYEVEWSADLVVCAVAPPCAISCGWVLLDQVTTGAELRRQVSGQTAHTPSLTQRQSELLALLAQGISPHDAAQELHVTSNTVKTHLRGLYRKLRVTGKTQAVVQAFRLGLIRS